MRRCWGMQIAAPGKLHFQAANPALCSVGGASLLSNSSFALALERLA